MAERETDEIFRLLRESAHTDISDDDIEKQQKRRRREQDHSFRNTIFTVVLFLMCGEVIIMCLIVALQGFNGIPGVPGTDFDLDRWVLAAFEAGVLIQTFALAKIITSHLFPTDAPLSKSNANADHAS